MAFFPTNRNPLTDLFFGTQPYMDTLLGETKMDELSKNAWGRTGLNTLLTWAAMPKRQGYGSAYDPRYFAQALVTSGLPAGRQTYTDALTGYKTKSELDIAKTKAALDAAKYGLDIKKHGLDVEKLEFEKEKVNLTPEIKNWNFYAKQVKEKGGVPMDFEQFRALPNDYQKKLYTYTTGLPWGTTSADGSTSGTFETKPSAYVYEIPESMGGGTIDFPDQQSLDAFLKAIRGLK